MNAAKKIRKLIDHAESPEHVEVLKNFVVALQLRQSFDIGRLYEVDASHFEAAMALLKEWRQDHFIAARSKLVERLLSETPSLMFVNSLAH